MNLFSHLLRALIFLFGAYALLHVHPIIGMFIFLSGLFSLLFVLRRSIWLTPSPSADYWEASIVLLIVLHSLLLIFGLYNNSFIPLDVPMHIIGGAIIAWWAVLVFEGELRLVRARILKLAVIAIAMAALLGVLWEGFEWSFDHTLGAQYHLPTAQPTNDDTMKDLGNDLLGGIIVALFAARKKERA